MARDPAIDSLVPPADEQRSNRGDNGVQPGGHPPLDAAKIRLGGLLILPGREQQRHVDGHTGKDALLDGRQALVRPGDLDENMRSLRPGMQRLGLLNGGIRIAGQQRETSRETQPSTPSVRA